MVVDEDSCQNLPLSPLYTSAWTFIGGFSAHVIRIKSKYDQEIPQSHASDQPTAPLLELMCWHIWTAVHASKYSKTCVKRPLKIDKRKILMTNVSLRKVKSIAECSP